MTRFQPTVLADPIRTVPPMFLTPPGPGEDDEEDDDEDFDDDDFEDEED